MDSDSSNLHLIEKNLWLGNLWAAANTEIIYEKKINFILTVNSFPLPKKITDLSYLCVKYIKVFDTPRDDLLSHFEETYDFIDQAVKKGVILIHCYQGVSRSATIVLSYIMKKKNMTVEEAFEYVKSKRESIEPNLGFLEQLKLYEVMHFSLDENNIQYKMFRLYILANHIKQTKAVPKFYDNIIRADPLRLRVNIDYTVYKCKKCRTIVASQSNLIPHVIKEKYSFENISWSKCSKITDFCQQIYFIEPLAWMKNIITSLEGKLHCPNTTCKSKLGSYSWISGCKCPCGAHICPGFFLSSSRVDKQNKVTFSR